MSIVNPPEIMLVSYNDRENFERFVNSALADRWKIRGELILGNGRDTNRYNVLLERPVLR